MDTRPAVPSSPSVWRLAPLAAVVLVALCAGFTSGSCTALWDSVDTGVIAALIAAGIALAVGLAFLVITRDRREAWFYAVNGVSAYTAFEFVAWVILVWPAIVAILIVIAGGIAAGGIARKAFRAGRGAAGSAGVISAFAIAISAGAVFYSFVDSEIVSINWGYAFDDSINYIPFAITVGSVPPVAACVASWLAGVVCRREPPLPGSGRGAAGAGQR